MKKLIKMIAVAMMTLSMAACANSNSDKNNNDANLQDFEKQLQKAGTLVVATSPDYPPFEALTATGELVGFDVDLMNAIAKQLTTADGKTYEIEWVQMSFDTIVSAVQAGQVDMGISGFTYDPERDVLFSTPYLESQQVVLTNANSPIKTLADLEGKHIGVQLGTTGESAAKEIPGATLLSIENVGVIMESLKNNAVDAAVLDKAVADNYAKNAGFVVLEEPLIDENMSIIVKKGNDALMETINQAIETVKASNEYQTLLQTWELNLD